MFDAPAPPPLLQKNLLQMLSSGAPVSIIDINPLEFARQITIKESAIFCSIQQSEFEKDAYSNDSSRAPNVRAMRDLSTDLSGWVADSILNETDAKRRASVLKQWLKIADKCLSLQNYNALMAIISALDSSTISRLKQTWSALSSKHKSALDYMRTITDHSRNFSLYRSKIRESIAPCLPFLGLYLTDLTFLDEGNPTWRRSLSIECTSVKIVNFSKFIRTAKLLAEINRFQVPYQLREVPEMQEWISDTIFRLRSDKINDVSELYRRSLLVEPRPSISSSNSVF